VDGVEALAQFVLRPFQPVQPMLADSAADVGDALATLGDASFEYKLDGARIQVHKAGDEGKVYSRKLRGVRMAGPAGVAVARALLGEQAAPANLVPRILTSNADAAAAFAARALASGHEGVMAKAVDGVYAAGRRGQTWLKVKQARTLDLVILAVEWGSGRRRGTLSNLHLGARDTERGGFVMLGKTFKGLTDRMLAWQTKKFLALEIGRDAYTVFIRPEVVAEVAFNEIQASSQYPGGLALRFARVKRYRADKSAADADTFATIQEMYAQASKL